MNKLSCRKALRRRLLLLPLQCRHFMTRPRSLRSRLYSKARQRRHQAQYQSRVSLGDMCQRRLSRLERRRVWGVAVRRELARHCLAPHLRQRQPMVLQPPMLFLLFLDSLLPALHHSAPRRLQHHRRRLLVSQFRFLRLQHQRRRLLVFQIHLRLLQHRLFPIIPSAQHLPPVLSGSEQALPTLWAQRLQLLISAQAHSSVGGVAYPERHPGMSTLAEKNAMLLLLSPFQPDSRRQSPRP